MDVASKINDIVKTRGVKITAISKATGISVDALSRSLLGKRKMLAEEFVGICDFLNLDMSAFANDSQV